MSNEPRPRFLFKDSAGNALPMEVPGFGPQAGDTTYLNLTYAEVAGITAAREWQHAQTDRGLLANMLAWESIKFDVAALSEVAPEEQEERFAEWWGYETEAFTAIIALSRLWQKRAQEEREKLAHHHPEIP